MKKIGWFSFACYLLLTLFCIGTLIYVIIASGTPGENGEGLALVVYLILAIVFGVPGLVGVILKLIHMKSGWALFGLLCILLDFVFVVMFIGMAAPGGNFEQITLSDIIPSLPFIAVLIVSAVSNALSLKN